MNVACTNFGECKFAGQPLWLEELDACQNCGKSLVSPHSVSLDPTPGTVSEGDTVTVLVNFEVNRGRTGKLRLKYDDAPVGPPIPVQGKGAQSFTIESISAGLHRLRAVLKTDDGHVTRSRRQLTATRESTLLGPLLWVLLLIILLSLSASLGWFGRPHFGWTPDQSLINAIDVITILAALLIGALLIDLGRRERGLERHDTRHQGLRGTLVKHQSTEHLSGKYPRANRALKQSGSISSSGLALMIIGALPFCFAAAYFASVYFRAEHSGLIVVALAIAIVIALLLWGASLKSWSGQLTSKLSFRPGIGARTDDKKSSKPKLDGNGNTPPEDRI